MPNTGRNAKIRAANALPNLLLILSLLVGVAGMSSCTIILAYIKEKGHGLSHAPNQSTDYLINASF